MAGFGELLTREDKDLNIKFAHLRKRVYMFALDENRRVFCRVICDLDKDDRFMEPESCDGSIKMVADLLFVSYDRSHGVFDWDGRTVVRYSDKGDLEKFEDAYKRGVEYGIKNARVIQSY